MAVPSLVIPKATVLNLGLADWGGIGRLQADVGRSWTPTDRTVSPLIHRRTCPTRRHAYCKSALDPHVAGLDGSGVIDAGDIGQLSCLWGE